MPRIAFGFALVLAVLAGVATPAAADNTSNSGLAARDTHELAAQASRPRITIHPRRTTPGANSKRYCRSWLAQEYRVSGTVIVPRMQCWWQ